MKPKKIDFEVFLTLSTKEQYEHYKLTQGTSWQDRSFYMDMLVTAIDENSPASLIFEKRLKVPYQNIKKYMEENKPCYICGDVGPKNYLTNLGRFESKEHDVYLCLKCKVEMQTKINNLLNN